MNNAEGEIDSTSDAVRPYGKDNDLGYFQRIASVDFPFTKANATKDDLLKKLNSRLGSIEAIINNTDSIECLQTVYDALGNILAQAVPPPISTKKRKPCNENSEIQRRFYSTRKRRKIATKLIEKPSIDEAKSCEQTLQSTETDICAICFYEDDTVNTERVNWVSCVICSVWMHKSCANIHDQSDFICSYCN